MIDIYCVPLIVNVDKQPIVITIYFLYILFLYVLHIIYESHLKIVQFHKMVNDPWEILTLLLCFLTLNTI